MKIIWVLINLSTIDPGNGGSRGKFASIAQ